MSVALRQPALVSVPLVGLHPITLDDGNRLLVAWGHQLGPVNRPFTMQAFALELDGRPISVAVSASVVSATVAGYRRTEVVECARLCSESGNRWANRVMLRLWREVCAPRWPDWPALAAISYSKNALHRGELYRTDGWTKVREDCSSGGGGTWSRPRYAGEVVAGRKTLWLWRFDR